MMEGCAHARKSWYSRENAISLAFDLEPRPSFTAIGISPRSLRFKLAWYTVPSAPLPSLEVKTSARPSFIWIVSFPIVTM